MIVCIICHLNPLILQSSSCCAVCLHPACACNHAFRRCHFSPPRIRKFRSGYGRKLRSTKKLQLLAGGLTRRKLLRTYQRALRIGHPSKAWKLIMGIEGSAGEWRAQWHCFRAFLV